MISPLPIPDLSNVLVSGFFYLMKLTFVAFKGSPLVTLIGPFFMPIPGPPPRTPPDGILIGFCVSNPVRFLFSITLVLFLDPALFLTMGWRGSSGILRFSGSDSSFLDEFTRFGMDAEVDAVEVRLKSSMAWLTTCPTLYADPGLSS